MSTDLLDLAKRTLGANGIKKLAGLLGESEDRTGNAFNLAGSAILAGLIRQTSTPDGAKTALDKLSDLDSSVPDQVGSLVGGDESGIDKNSLTELGEAAVGKLFGDKAGSLVSMVAKLSGIGDASAKSMLSMIAPLVLGTISKLTREQGLDAAGISGLLADQKAVVAKNLPSQFSQTLGLADIPGIGGSSPSRAPETNERRRAGDVVEADRGAFWRFAVPLAIVGCFGFLVWKMTSEETNPPTIAAADGETEDRITSDTNTSEGNVDDRVTVQRPALPDFDIAKAGPQVEKALTQVVDEIGGITDVETAREAVPGIEALTRQLSQFGSSEAPAGFQAKLQQKIEPLVKKLRTAVAAAVAIPGVQEILDPVVTPLMKAIGDG